MGIDSGNYRIRKRSSNDKTKVSYLRVTMKGKDKYFQVDHGEPYLVTQDDETFELDAYEIVGMIDRRISIHRPKIKVSFQDDKGYNVEMEVSNLPAFENIMKLFPKLKEEMSLKG